MYSLYITDYYQKCNSNSSAPQNEDCVVSEGSRVIIGGHDLNKYSKPNSQITWNSLINQNYWMVNMNSI